MNAPERVAFLPDIQSELDGRGLSIDAVGIKDIRYPVKVRSGKRVMPTIATFSMTVGLSASTKGTHMSRFIRLLEAQTHPLDPWRFETMLFDMLQQLEASSGTIEMKFAHFVRKAAPVSGVQSELDHEVTWRVTKPEQTPHTFSMGVKVPATSLCPCSKEISAYGAHNQRSLISIEAELVEPMEIEELIDIAERGASCEVYGLLKRVDEKFVTERAYDNAKFVEDIVRDVALALGHESRVGAFVVEAENFESIHNHSAFARIVGNNRAPVDGATHCAMSGEVLQQRPSAALVHA